MVNVKGSYGRFACIPDKEGKLLLAQRRLRRNPNTQQLEPDDRWNLIGGGVDEKDAEAMVSGIEMLYREVREETGGLTVDIDDERPVGEYPTAKHTDLAITYLCEPVGGHLSETEESKAFKYVTPIEAMEMAKIGDVPNGLVGGLKTSTGGVARHIQMVLHYFTRVCKNPDYRREADKFCRELHISS